MWEEAEQDKLQLVRESELHLPECSGSHTFRLRGVELVTGVTPETMPRLFGLRKSASESILEERGKTENDILLKQCLRVQRLFLFPRMLGDRAKGRIALWEVQAKLPQAVWEM